MISYSGKVVPYVHVHLRYGWNNVANVLKWDNCEHAYVWAPFAKDESLMVHNWAHQAMIVLSLQLSSICQRKLEWMRVIVPPLLFFHLFFSLLVGQSSSGLGNSKYSPSPMLAFHLSIFIRLGSASNPILSSNLQFCSFQCPDFCPAGFRCSRPALFTCAALVSIYDFWARTSCACSEMVNRNKWCVVQNRRWANCGIALAGGVGRANDGWYGG